MKKHQCTKDELGRFHSYGEEASIITYDYEAWHHHGVRHRLNGPALIYSSGYRIWYYYGQSFLNKEDWFNVMSPEDKKNVVWILDEIS